MKQHTFADYAAYVEAQTALTRYKTDGKPDHRSYVRPAVVDAVAGHHGNVPPAYGCCHGVRCGGELDLFAAALGGAWIGTEITPELCDGVRIIHHDFCLPRRAWRGYFDVIYSNSLDHAYDPVKAVAVWLGQLHPDGTLYVEWTPWHDRLGRYWHGDCFAANEDEYRDLLEDQGDIVATLVVPETWSRGTFEHKVFAVRRC